MRGVAGGGLRMRAGCTLDEVTGPARGMTVKEVLRYAPANRYKPLGGAEGGIDGLAAHVTSYAGAVPRTRAQQWVEEALSRELAL